MKYVLGNEVKDKEDLKEICGNEKEDLEVVNKWEEQVREERADREGEAD